MTTSRPPLTDAELQEALERRVAFEQLDADDRADIIRAARLRALATGGPSPFGRIAAWVAGVAAVAVLLVVAAPMVLSPPRASPAPGTAQASPATFAPSSVPSASALPSPDVSALRIYSAQQLSDMIGTPQRIGTVALAHARISPMRTGQIGCMPPDACNVAFLADVSGRNVVSVGWRPALNGEGTRYEDGTGVVRWLTPLSLPTEAGLFAFRVLSDSVEYLGPVVETPTGETVWTVSDIKGGDHPEPSDEVYAVAGWLVQTSPVSCPAPPDLGSNSDLSYYCGGSWITPDPTRSIISRSGNAMVFRLIFDDGLHVQHGAYDEFAVAPAADDLGAVPRFATYLIRPAGCPVDVMGDCPVWRMLGRLEPGAPSPNAAEAACSAILDDIPMVIVKSGKAALAAAYEVTGEQLATYLETTFGHGRSQWRDRPTQVVEMCIFDGDFDTMTPGPPGDKSALRVLVVISDGVAQFWARTRETSAIPTTDPATMAP